MSAASTLGLNAARAADPAAYAISGAIPRHAVCPATRGELVEAVRAAAAEDLKIVPWGGGVSLHMVAPPPRYDVALDLTALNRIVEYDADDLTITAECGVTLHALRNALAARGQELPLEGARSDVATLGGALAANTSGARRLRFGAPVDRILGARFVLGDGTFARSGGRVVKNVAGYAVHRLLCGSRGGLGIIVEASLKLLPRPEARRLLVFGASAAEIADAARWASFPRMEPAGLTVVGREVARTLHVATPTPNDFVVIAGFEDEDGWVAQQAARATEALGQPEAIIEGDDAFAMWDSLADLEEHPAPRVSLTTARRSPAALAPLAGTAHAEALVFHAMAGRLHVRVDPAAAPALEETLRAAGFAVIDRRGVPAPEPTIAGMAVRGMRERLRAALDPSARLALGGRATA
jgi:glycolate oxidase FAD binding subunit